MKVMSSECSSMLKALSFGLKCHLIMGDVMVLGDTSQRNLSFCVSSYREGDIFYLECISIIGYKRDLFINFSWRREVPEVFHE